MELDFVKCLIWPVGLVFPEFDKAKLPVKAKINVGTFKDILDSYVLLTLWLVW